MNRNEFNAHVRTSQARMIERLQKVPSGEAEQPIHPGSWSVKELAAHLTYWQALINRQIQAALSGQRPEPGPQTQQEVNERNRQAADAIATKGYEEVLHDFERSCADLSHTLDLISEEDLFAVNRFEAFDEEPLWQSIAIETYEHFEEHYPDLERWSSLL